MTRGAQLDLLDYQPPQAPLRFDPAKIQAPSLAARIARTVAAVLKECGRPRGQIAEAMSLYTAKPVTKQMLDAYASASRDEHPITAERLVALLAVTRDRRLIQFLLDFTGQVAVDPADLHWIEAGQLQAAIETATKAKKSAVAKAKAGAR